MRMNMYIYIYVYIPVSVGCPCGVMVKAMDCGIVVSEFVLQSLNYVHFPVKTFWKGMNPPSYGLDIAITVLLGEYF